MTNRLIFVDRLRTALTALVVLHHAAIIYGGSGGWFYHELPPSAAPSSLLLTLFLATNQAWFMGFFFLLAGYFTPPSLERKGTGGFLRDRLLRLGIPLLFFILILGPLTAAMVEAVTGAGFWPCIHWLWLHQRIINGPLWFAQALLIFSALWVMLSRWIKPERGPRLLPGMHWWMLSALVVGAVAFALRLLVPVGQNLFGLQIGYFASYVFLFFVGVVAWYRLWLDQITRRRCWQMILVALLVWPMLPVTLAIWAKSGAASGFSGGWNPQALIYAFWEPLVAWGIIAAAIIAARRWANHDSRLMDWLDRRAFAVYVLHPPILTGVALLLRPWQGAALEKFAVVGVLSCLACWLVADLVLRLPGVKRVL